MVRLSVIPSSKLNQLMVFVDKLKQQMGINVTVVILSCKLKQLICFPPSFSNQADGTTPSIAVQKCIYNALLQDEPLGAISLGLLAMCLHMLLLENVCFWSNYVKLKKKETDELAYFFKENENTWKLWFIKKDHKTDQEMQLFQRSIFSRSSPMFQRLPGAWSSFQTPLQRSPRACLDLLRRPQTSMQKKLRKIHKEPEMSIFGCLFEIWIWWNNIS